MELSDPRSPGMMYPGTRVKDWERVHADYIKNTDLSLTPKGLLRFDQRSLDC